MDKLKKAAYEDELKRMNANNDINEPNHYNPAHFDPPYAEYQPKRKTVPTKHVAPDFFRQDSPPPARSSEITKSFESPIIHSKDIFRPKADKLKAVIKINVQGKGQQ